MNLADAIAADQPRRGPRCGYHRVKAGMDPDDAATFDRLLDEVRQGLRTATSVARILDRVDQHWTANQVSRHIRGECACDQAQP